MKALELAQAAVDFAKEGELIHLCSSHAICSLLAASAAELRRLAEVNAELLVALERAKGLLDRYRLETPMGNQPYMITLEAYECSNAIKTLSAKAKEQQ